MTRVEEYCRDREKLISAIVLLGGILLTLIVVLVSHLLFWRA